VRTLKGHYADISSLIELSNGNLASGSWDHLIKIWDGNNGQHLKTIITGYTSDVSSLVELKKSGYLVSGSGYGDGTIKIWY
jgi:WD40 repeat protein